MLNSFPQGRDDKDVLLRTYEAILRDMPDGFIVDAAQRFTSGLVTGQSLEFAPAVAGFAAEVRRMNEARMELQRRSALPPPKPALCPVATIKARAEMEMADRRILAEDMTMDGFKSNRWPPGAQYVAILGKVFAPA